MILLAEYLQALDELAQDPDVSFVILLGLALALEQPLGETA